MERNSPVYTTSAECQDCFKCVRNCPAKAIRIKDAHAEVIPELCVACGRCVSICPAKAKRVRDDVPKAKSLIASGARVHVSLAPSWASEFPELGVPGVCGMLKSLGFAGVSETALGAERVSESVAKLLESGSAGAMVSSACPAVKRFVSLHIPEWAGAVSSLPSPLLEHCRMLKGRFGAGVKTVFVGPCVAKKLESDSHPELLDCALGFDDVRAWLKSEGRNPEDFGRMEGKGFEMRGAEEGAFYPVEGGMIESMGFRKGFRRHSALAFSGLASLKAALANSLPSDIGGPLLIEALACKGGCVNGPCMGSALPPFRRMQTVMACAKPPERTPERGSAEPVECPPSPAVAAKAPSEQELSDALRQVGKVSPDDELNCGGCGYESCRNFAHALCAGHAEPSMCVSYMRKLATRKANALLRCMPCGVVIADASMRILECNLKFAEMLDEGARLAFEAKPGLAGANIYKLLPFGDLFREALETGRDVPHARCRIGDRLLDVAVFTVDPGAAVGATLSDVTCTEMRRDQIARKAGEVISKNILAVQDIAWRLGEHMADTEILLRSIADGFGGATQREFGDWKDVTAEPGLQEDAP